MSTSDATEHLKSLRTDDAALAAFILLHYGTPRKLADLLDEIHKGLDESFNPHSQNRLESAAFWIDKQACEEAAAEARNARIAHMCDYEDSHDD